MSLNKYLEPAQGGDHREIDGREPFVRGGPSCLGGSSNLASQQPGLT